MALIWLSQLRHRYDCPSWLPCRWRCWDTLTSSHLRVFVHAVCSWSKSRTFLLLLTGSLVHFPGWNHPDMTFVVGWALKTNDLSIYSVLGGWPYLSASPILQVRGLVLVAGFGPGRIWQPCTLQCHLQTALPVRSVYPVDHWCRPGINTVQVQIDPWGTPGMFTRTMKNSQRANKIKSVKSLSYSRPDSVVSALNSSSTCCIHHYQYHLSPVSVTSVRQKLWSTLVGTTNTISVITKLIKIRQDFTFLPLGTNHNFCFLDWTNALTVLPHVSYTRRIMVLWKRNLIWGWMGKMTRHVKLLFDWRGKVMAQWVDDWGSTRRRMWCITM